MRTGWRNRLMPVWQPRPERNKIIILVRLAAEYCDVANRGDER
jgi:hypothetical protein